MRFNTNHDLVRVLVQERLASLVGYLPSDVRYLSSLPEEVLSQVLNRSIMRQAALLFCGYLVMVVGTVSVMVWYVIAGSEKMLGSVYRRVSQILRRERLLSAKIELIEMNEIGYLTGYFNLLLDQVSLVGQQVLARGQSLQQLLQLLQRGSQQNHGLLDHLNEGVSEIETQAQMQVVSNEEISSSLNQLLENVQDIDSNLSNQRQMVEGISRQVGGFAAAVKRVEQLTAQAHDETQRLVDLVRSGEQAVRSLIAAMKGISDSSSTIEKIVVAISRIAAQTSMLSMNAAIEAAHAGNYGSGFAVVAQEVRTLSEGATQQSRNIREEIQQLLQGVEQGLQLSGSISNTLEQINSYIGSTYEVVELISQAMEGQIAGSKKIVWSVESVVLSSRRIGSWTQKQDSKSKEIQQDIARLGYLAEAVREDTIEMRQDIGALQKSVAAFDHILQRGQDKLLDLLGQTQEMFEGAEK